MLLIGVIGFGFFNVDSTQRLDQQKVIETYPRLESIHDLGANFHPIKLFCETLDIGVWSKFMTDDHYVIIETFDNEWVALTNRDTVKGSIYKETQTYQGVTFTMEIGFMTEIDEPQNIIAVVKMKHDRRVTSIVIIFDSNTLPYQIGETLREEDKTWVTEFVRDFILNEKHN